MCLDRRHWILILNPGGLAIVIKCRYGSIHQIIWRSFSFAEAGSVFSKRVVLHYQIRKDGRETYEREGARRARLVPGLFWWDTEDSQTFPERFVYSSMIRILTVAHDKSDASLSIFEPFLETTVAGRNGFSTRACNWRDIRSVVLDCKDKNHNSESNEDL